MKLIADSGSTKTDWTLTKGGKRVHKITTQGINPFYHTTEQIITILENELLPHLELIPPSLFFYGAGCSFSEKKTILLNALKHTLGEDIKVSLNSDLVGAARALAGNKKGIVCILGTGSNSCYWDGEKILSNTPPLGYILGDEGSGAVLGKLFIADLLKNQLPKKLSNAFFKKYKTNYEQLMAIVYKLPYPNQNLAKYTYFLKENINEKHINTLIRNSFSSFIDRNISNYPKKLPVHFVGSISIIFENILREVLAEKGYTAGFFLKAPIEALEKFHN